jgi:membrane protein implicated in regulation of membrane protease activity
MSVELIWIVLGIGMILAEFIVPGLIVIFFGISALVVGLLAWWGVLTDTTYQLWLFGILSGGLLLTLRNRFKAWFQGGSLVADTDTPDDDYIGHYATVLNGFDNDSAFGKVTYRDAHWSAKSANGETVTAGERVLITGRQGSTLIIQKEA